MQFEVRKRQPVVVPPELVTFRPLAEGAELPLVAEPAIAPVDLASWALDQRARIRELVQRHGAVLLRNFDVRSPEAFHSVVDAVSGGPLEYTERSSPRSTVVGNIYTSTDYPAEYPIFPHNEHSYSTRFPLRLFFYCEQPAAQGGRTPLADTRRIYQRIPLEIREEFLGKGWMYVRNFNAGFGLTWQTVFRTPDPAVVEDYCRHAQIQTEWLPGDRLRTRQVRRAIHRHPHTGELVWFNHATFFHVTTLQTSVTEALRSDYAEHEMPNNTFFGDGSPIPDDVVAILRQAYTEELVSFEWRPGDIVVLDNMLTAHGREAFAGTRRVLFAMAEPVELKDTGLKTD